ncbi:MAG TPA: ATPase, T2SS/T4P/T4SS family [Actinomycetes bacterium]|nr:ATPase, T2SS/T4P/T4SS family [Actinomycetes bacterium]
MSLEPAEPRPAHAGAGYEHALHSAAVPRFVDPEERRRLGAVLVGRGRLTPSQLQEALDAQAGAPAGRRRLGQVLVDLGMVTELEVAGAVADLMGLPLVDLSDVRPEPDLVRVLPRAFAVAHRVAVIDRRADRLVVALADPLNVVVLDDVRLIAGVKELDIRVATESQVVDLISRMYAGRVGIGAVDAVLEQLEQPRAPESSSAAAVVDIEAAPVVRLVNAILTGALDARASDVHIEPHPSGLRVRYRVDGMLRDVMEVPPGAAPTVLGRLKIMAGLDIAERRVPQDGRTNIVLDGRQLDARVSTLPSIHGEKVVLRLLDNGAALPTLDHLGMLPLEEALVRRTLGSSQGLVLITGPTGSGKTSTLYAALRETLTAERNVVTLEDPVEVQLPGITQVQVNERTGMTFARGLRAVLRQDPDVVLVGEVRDAETAELALRASLTGHLLLTTLHTNDSVSAITRLVDMGAEPFLVASSLSLVIAQRLVRRPCPSCSRPSDPDPETLAALGLDASALVGGHFVRGGGCAECGETGYRGRVGVFEVLQVTPHVRAALLSDPTESSLAAASTGRTTLRSAALALARSGGTTLREVLRATELSDANHLACVTCGRGLDPAMLACPWCATPVHHSRCSGCGRRRDNGWVICPWCAGP